VSDYKAGDVFRVDPTRRRVTAHRHVCRGAQGMAPTASALWVTCTAADEVATVDPTTLKPLGHISVPGEPDAIVARGNTTYVAATDGPRLVTMTTASGAPTVTGNRKLGTDLPLDDQANVDLLVLGDRFYVSSPTGGHVIAGTR
jgi:hypothetical protein